MDEDNPLPGFIDPITLQPVVNPAISPHGHVMGLQTWKVRRRKYAFSMIWLVRSALLEAVLS